MQPDGKIVVVGLANEDNFATARLDIDGTFDSSYSAAGRQAVSFGATEVADAVALQTDGKIVVAGHTNANGTNDFAIIRMNPDGTIDPAFNDVAVPSISNGDGRLTISFGADGPVRRRSRSRTTGKIVVAGYSDDGSSNFAVARLNSNGTLDASFSGDGQYEFSFGAIDKAYDMAIDSEGRIVVVGSYRSGTNTQFAIAQLTTTEVLDVSFDTDGKLTLDFTNDAAAADDNEDVATGVATQPDGKIVVAGWGRCERQLGLHRGAPGCRWHVRPQVQQSTAALQRWVEDDRPGGGRPNLIERTGRVAVLHNGKIAVVGSIGTAAARVSMAVLVLDRDGTVDSTFDADGELTIDFGANEDGREIAIHPDGSIVLVGGTDSGDDFAIAKNRRGRADRYRLQHRRSADPRLLDGRDGARRHRDPVGGSTSSPASTARRRTTLPRRATT